MSIQRNTVQRQIILESLKAFHTHPTVDEIYAEIHKSHPNISRTTVYRNLRQLADSGEIRKVLLPDQSERYDNRADQHYHFTCKACGSIYDVDIGYLADIDNAVREKLNFQVDGHDIVFTGVCPQCSDIK